MSYFLSFLSGLDGPPAVLTLVNCPKVSSCRADLQIYNAALVFVVVQCLREHAHEGSLFA